MVPWWKRLLISLMSWVAGSVLGAGVMVAEMFASDPPPMAHALDSLAAVAYLAPIFLLVSFIGWVVALPAVLLVTAFCRWRLWMWLGLGTCVGPVLWIVFRVLTERGSARFDVSAMPVEVVTVSFLSALIYLLLVRRAQRIAGAVRRLDSV